MSHPHDSDRNNANNTPKGLALLLRLLGSLEGGRTRVSARPPFEIVTGIIAESVVMNLEEAGIDDLRVEGVALLEVAAVFIRKADIDKVKAKELFDLALDGERINKSEKATALAAELMIGHVEACHCERHPLIMLDDLPEKATKPMEEPQAEQAPV